MKEMSQDEVSLASSICRDSFAFFVREFWSQIIAEELVWEPHMTVLCDEIQAVYSRVFLRPDPTDPEPNPDKKRKIRLPKEHDLIINIPPGTSKSTIVTIMAPAWAWTRDPSLRIITGSYSDSLATEHSTKSRDVITSDLYRLYFPEVQIKDHKGLKSNYETTANGQRFATSVGGTVTGVHAHVKNIDDPLNPQQAASKAECKTANMWHDTTLSTRNIDNEVTVEIVIMQRLAVNDLTGHLLEKKKVNARHICLPGELGKNVTPEYVCIYENGLLSPKRLGRKALDEKRIDLGESGYAGQINQHPSPEGGTIWKSDWFKVIPDYLFPSEEQAEQVWTDWDTAFTKEEQNAASAYIRSGIYAGNVYLFDIDWKWLEFPELIKWMKSVKGPHKIEAKATGKSAKQVLKQQRIIAIEVKVSADKVARAKSATPIAEAGFVYVKQSQADRFFNDSKQGILFFPNGQYADVADTLSQCLVQRSKNGKIVVANSRRDPDPDPDPDPDQPEKEDPLDWA